MKSLGYSLVLFGLTLSFATGCQTTASRMAWMNPARMWNRGGDETTLAKDSSAPELPSKQFAANTDTGVPAATDSGSSAPPFTNVASSSAFPAVVPGYTPPATPPTIDSAPQAGMTPQMSPYSAAAVASQQTKPVDPIASTGTSTQAPFDISKPVTMPGSDVYGQYQNQLPQAAEQVAQNLSQTAEAPLSQISVPPMPEMPKIDAFGSFSQPTPPIPTTVPTAPSGLAAQPIAPVPTGTVATSVELPVSGAGYSPGGTSRYPSSTTDAVNIATRPTAESSPSVGLPSTPYR